MEYITGKTNFKLNNTVVTIGKFDCFHKGHQLLFRIGAEIKADGMKQVIFSFMNNPSDVVNQAVSRHVLSQNERSFHAEKCGADYFIEYPFDDLIRNMSPEEFTEKILIEKLGAKAVVCGDDFRFGKDRVGDSVTLTELGKRFGFDVRVVERLKYRDQYISSSYIKSEVLKGHLDDVKAMLGRPFTMSSPIEHGAHLGTGMGIPTINFKVPADKILPPDGVYATETLLKGDFCPSITNIGVRPTFYKDGERVVETNLLDDSGDYYGENAVVVFHAFIRPEKRFSGAEELTEQIRSDIIRTREYLSKMEH